jgi:hypothetical protein
MEAKWNSSILLASMGSRNVTWISFLLSIRLGTCHEHVTVPLNFCIKFAY